MFTKKKKAFKNVLMYGEYIYKSDSCAKKKKAGTSNRLCQIIN